MSRNNVGMMIATLESQLNYIFSELPEKVFFTEAEIHDQYNEQTGDNLDDKLRRVNMNLGEFMTQRFFEKFNVVSGPDNNGFMRRDFLRSLAGGSAIAASNGTSNGTSRTSPPNTNGIGFSTSIQSSFPASPPVVPQATRFSPPGLGNLSSNNSQRLVDQRMDKLQKQFSDRGFEDDQVSEEDQQQQTNCQIEECHDDDDNESFHSGKSNPTLNEEQSHVIVETPDSEDESRFTMGGKDFPPLGQTMSTSKPTSQKTSVVGPPPGFEPPGFESSPPGFDTSPPPGFEHLAPTFSRNGSTESNKNEQKEEEELEEEELEESEEEEEIVESPKPTEVPKSTKTPIEIPAEAPKARSVSKTPEPSEKKSNAEKTFFESLKASSPKSSNVPSPKPSESPKPTRSNFQTPFGSSNEFSESDKSPKPPTASKTQTKWRPVDASFLPDFQPNKNLLYYRVLQGSIINSPDVNRYRNNEYHDYLTANTKLYKRPSNKFVWLTGEHLSSNPNTIGFMPYHSFVIDVLQLYSKLYRDGIPPVVLIELEQKLCATNQTVCLGKSTNIMSIAEMIEKEMLYEDKTTNLYKVDPEILDIKLWKLPPGLTSNLYRILNAQQNTMIQDVVSYCGVLNNTNGDPVCLHEEDIVRQANMFPLVFNIEAQAIEQHSMQHGNISLHKELPRWKVLLDYAGFNNSTHVPFHCDCLKCNENLEFTPVNVPK